MIQKIKSLILQYSPVKLFIGIIFSFFLILFSHLIFIRYSKNIDTNLDNIAQTYQQKELVYYVFDFIPCEMGHRIYEGRKYFLLDHTKSNGFSDSIRKNVCEMIIEYNVHMEDENTLGFLFNAGYYTIPILSLFFYAITFIALAITKFTNLHKIKFWLKYIITSYTISITIIYLFEIIFMVLFITTWNGPGL